jgi:tetratricopeptide (TPR) repeat protein
VLNAIDSLGYTEQEKNYLYNAGAQKCQIGDFKGALAIFQFLHMLDYKNIAYSKAIAGCMHGLENYEAAIYFYNYTYEGLTDRSNYDCLFYIARCYIKLNNYEETRVSLEKFLRLCDEDKVSQDIYNKLIKKAHILLKSVNLGGHG